MSKKKKIALATVAGILVLGGACLLTGCGGDSSSSAGGTGGGNTPPPNVIPGPPPAPEDPLQIVDNDNDGTWDDIQTYIIETYPNSAKERAFLTQYAQVLQAALVDANDKALSRQHSIEVGISMECGKYITGDWERTGTMILDIKAHFLSVGERKSVYYEQYDRNIGGGTYPGLKLNPTADSCTFDPSTLPN